MKFGKFTKICAFALAVAGFASANAFEYEGIQYDIRSMADKTVTLIAGPSTNPDTVVIPDKVMKGSVEYTVTAIGPKAFNANTEMKVVYLPSTLEIIEAEAFWGPSSTLRQIYAQSKVPADVSSTPFATLITMNGTLYVPEDCWFAYAKAWERFYTILEPNVFNASVNGMNYQIFSPTSKYARVKSSNPKYTGDVVVPATIEYNDVTYKVVELGAYCFDGCGDITSLTLPEGLLSVGAYCMRKTNKLENVKFPSTTALYSGGIFNASTGIKTVDMNTSASRVENVVFQNCTALKSVILPPNTWYLGPSTFSGCTALETVTNSEKITTIMSGCFTNTPKLNMHLPKNLVMLENTAFKNSGVIVDEFPATLDYVEANIFAQCPHIKNIKITRTLKKLGTAAFQNCVNLESIELPDTVLDPAPGINLFAGCSKLTKVKLPKTLTYMPAYMFQKDSLLEGVDIPESVTAFHNGVFSTCVSLKNFELPKNLESIAAQCFANCKSLTEMSLPETVNIIGSGLFANCSNLEKVKLSNKIAILNSFTFQNCEKLAEVKGIDSITTIANGAFLSCTSLTEFTVPKNVKQIWNTAFKNCTGFKSVTLNAGLDSIAKQAFLNCTGLTEIRIPASVRYIKDQAFSGCTGISSVYSSALTPPELVTNAFDSVTYTTANLYVKNDVKSVYAAAEGWKNFTHLQSGVNAATDNDTPEVYGVEGAIVAPEEAMVYTLQGRRTRRTDIPAGVYIVAYRNKTYKVMVK